MINQRKGSVLIAFVLNETSPFGVNKARFKNRYNQLFNGVFIPFGTYWVRKTSYWKSSCEDGSHLPSLKVKKKNDSA